MSTPLRDEGEVLVSQDTAADAWSEVELPGMSNLAPSAAGGSFSAAATTVLEALDETRSALAMLRQTRKDVNAAIRVLVEDEKRLSRMARIAEAEREEAERGAAQGDQGDDRE